MRSWLFCCGSYPHILALESSETKRRSFLGGAPAGLTKCRWLFDESHVGGMLLTWTVVSRRFKSVIVASPKEMT